MTSSHFASFTTISTYTQHPRLEFCNSTNTLHPLGFSPCPSPETLKRFVCVCDVFKIIFWAFSSSQNLLAPTDVMWIGKGTNFLCALTICSYKFRSEHFKAFYLYRQSPKISQLLYIFCVLTMIVDDYCQLRKVYQSWYIIWFLPEVRGTNCIKNYVFELSFFVLFFFKHFMNDS